MGVGEAGLTGEYFDNPDFAGDPRLTRVDRLVDRQWKNTTPLTGQWGDPFSVRWTGALIPPASGVHRLGVYGYSSYRLYLDGELVAESDFAHHPLLQTCQVELEAGRLYPLRLEYVSRGLDPQVQLLWAPPGEEPTAQALEVARKADVVIAVMGLSPRLEGEEMPVRIDGFVGGDRSDIQLPAPQEQLLRQLDALGKPVVLVLLNGSALAVNWAAAHIPAIVEAWYPGQAGGAALADVLFGDYNPAGRLPVTFYRSVDDLPPFDDYSMAGRTYRYFRGEPLFPFGHGLSYTTFTLSDLRIEPARLVLGQSVTVSVDLANTGDRAGEEVVQLYLARPESAVPGPVRELKGLQRVPLAPGERLTVIFTLTSRRPEARDEALPSITEPGPVEVMVGSSSENLPLRSRLEVVG
jgi:beta-glucosidase